MRGRGVEVRGGLGNPEQKYCINSTPTVIADCQVGTIASCQLIWIIRSIGLAWKHPYPACRGLSAYACARASLFFESPKTSAAWWGHCACTKETLRSPWERGTGTCARSQEKTLMPNGKPTRSGSVLLSTLSNSPFSQGGGSWSGERPPRRDGAEGGWRLLPRLPLWSGGGVTGQTLPGLWRNGYRWSMGWTGP